MGKSSVVLLVLVSLSKNRNSKLHSGARGEKKRIFQKDSTLDSFHRKPQVTGNHSFKKLKQTKT